MIGAKEGFIVNKRLDPWLCEVIIITGRPDFNRKVHAGDVSYLHMVLELCMSVQALEIHMLAHDISCLFYW